MDGLGACRSSAIRDEEAFASIARGSADRLFAVAHRILRDVGRAEDAVQQTLVTAWDLPALRDIERFEAWIHRILVHTCYAEAKRASKWSANVVALPMDGPATPDATVSIETREATIDLRPEAAASPARS